MRNVINASMIAIGLLSNSSISLAQDRPNAAPHGGAVAKAGNYHIEMVKSGDAVVFYLLDATKKPLPNKGLTGTAVFAFGDGTSATMEMETMGDDRLRVVLFTASDFTVQVTLIVDKEQVNARFESGRRQPNPKEGTHTPADGHQH